jgi:hypothetical protein
MRSPVPDLIHGLRCLSSILSKAESHCANRKIDPDALLKARLYPDMFNLTRNVTTACDSAKFAAARLSQTEPPKYEDNEASFAELQGRIAKTITFLVTIPDAAFAAAETRELAVPLAPEGMINRGLTVMRQSTEVLQNRPGDNRVRISRRNASRRCSPGAPTCGVVDKKAGQSGGEVRLHRPHAHGKRSLCR